MSEAEMHDDAVVTTVAQALRKEASTFGRPVLLYVDDEARERWDKAHPDLDSWNDGPNIDWELESWKILARAALRAQSATTRDQP